MPNICHDGLRFVEPIVDRQIIVGDTAESTGAIFRVFQRMSHDLDLSRLVGVADGFIPVVLHANE